MRRAAPLLLFALAGCLVPQELDEMDPPRIGNAAPRIVQRLPASTEVVSQRDCQRASFSLGGIEDLDRGDELEVRWFVDYGPDQPVPQQVSVLPAAPDSVDGIRGGDRFEVRLSNYVHLGRVRVEAVVSDGFDPDADAEPLHRAVLPGRDWDETSWDLIITDENCQL